MAGVRRKMIDPELNKNYQQQYEEVCKSYHAIHDFRAKLLAFLPLATGLGGVALLSKPELQKFYLSLGVLGALITVGLYIYEARGIQRCHKLKQIAKELEGLLGLNAATAQFSGEPVPLLNIIREGAAGLVIYLSVFVGWVLVAFYGT
jgi:hypothetical protein